MPYLNADAFAREDAEGCAPEAVAEIEGVDPPAVPEGLLARSLCATSRHCCAQTVAEAAKRTRKRGSEMGAIRLCVAGGGHGLAHCQYDACRGVCKRLGGLPFLLALWTRTRGQYMVCGHCGAAIMSRRLEPCVLLDVAGWTALVVHSRR